MSGGGSNNYDPAKLGNTLGNKLTSYVNTPAPVFNKELYTGQGATTQGALGGILGNANPGGYSGHVNSAIGDFGDIAAGKRFGMDDPGYAQLRSKLGSDTLRDVNAIFTGSGRFGSGSHVDTATSSLGNVLAGLDYGNFQNDQQRQFGAASMLPQLYSASQMPGQTELAVGQLQDADSLAKRQSEFEHFDRTKNADYNRFKELLSAFTGSQEAAGMAEQPSFLQMLLGGIGTAAGIALR
jgi:hypothetical protein